MAYWKYCSKFAEHIIHNGYSMINTEDTLAIINTRKNQKSLNGNLHKIGKDINPLCRRCLNGNETVEHLLCECESLTTSRGRIFGQSFGELQQLSHVPVDLF